MLHTSNDYLVLMVDKKRALVFFRKAGFMTFSEEIIGDIVPQKVKHGENTWDAQNKIFRHIEDHLHRHLKRIGERVALLAKKDSLRNILIGGHKPMFKKMIDHIPYPFSDAIVGTFVSEINISYDKIYERANRAILELENSRQA